MSFDTAVIGAGLAGSFAAIKLASAGQKVILFERERGPHHKVCGEFLSGEAVACFDNVGLNLRALGGVAIDSVRLHGPKRSGACRLPFLPLVFRENSWMKHFC